MNLSFKILFLLILLSTFVFGCVPKNNTSENMGKPLTDPAIEQLNESADEIQENLRKLIRIKQANSEMAEIYEGPYEGPLSQEITLKWSGPLLDAVRSVADKIGYEFYQEGPEPLNGPILVTIEREGARAFEVLQELGWKTNRARIEVDRKIKAIRLTYLEGDNG